MNTKRMSHCLVELDYHKNEFSVGLRRGCGKDWHAPGASQQPRVRVNPHVSCILFTECLVAVLYSARTSAMCALCCKRIGLMRSGISLKLCSGMRYEICGTERCEI